MLPIKIKAYFKNENGDHLEQEMIIGAQFIIFIRDIDEFPEIKEAIKNKFPLVFVENMFVLNVLNMQTLIPCVMYSPSDKIMTSLKEIYSEICLLPLKNKD